MLHAILDRYAMAKPFLNESRSKQLGVNKCINTDKNKLPDSQKKS